MSDHCQSNCTYNILLRCTTQWTNLIGELFVIIMLWSSCYWPMCQTQTCTYSEYKVHSERLPWILDGRGEQKRFIWTKRFLYTELTRIKCIHSHTIIILDVPMRLHPPHCLIVGLTKCLQDHTLHIHCDFLLRSWLWTVKPLAYLQCLTTQSELQYSGPLSSENTAALVQPAFTQVLESLAVMLKVWGQRSTTHWAINR